MSSVKFERLFNTCLELFALKQFEALNLLLHQYKLDLGDTEEWEKVLDLLEQLPLGYLDRIPASHLYATAMKCLGQYSKLVEFAQHLRHTYGLVASSFVQIEAAAALNGLFEYEKAYSLLEETIPHLSKEDLGAALARLGFTSFNLQKPWQKSFEDALSLLAGEELGRALLNYGYCLSMSGKGIEARRVWLEALTCFKRNPYFLAWVRYNLATVTQNNLDAESERHLLAALEQTHHPKAEPLRATIWNGLGRFRYQLGEWNRADFAFLEAIKSSSDQHDRQEAYLGLIRSQYLSARFDEALETLEIALHDPDFNEPTFFIAQAKVYLKLGHLSSAKNALNNAGKPAFELREWAWRVASAELARQEGRLEEAVELLESLPIHTLHSREEVRQFPLLFELLHSTGKPVPQPLEYVQGTTVHVQAQGVLRVEVNGRRVDIAPTSRMGELLVFLLEQGGAASLDVLEEALYGHRPYTKRRRQAVWNLADKLREALGWQDSLINLRKAYQLDPKTTWHYDIAEARKRGQFKGEFLAGVYTDWALEVERELQELGPPERRIDLN